MPPPLDLSSDKESEPLSGSHERNSFKLIVLLAVLAGGFWLLKGEMSNKCEEGDKRWLAIMFSGMARHYLKEIESVEVTKLSSEQKSDTKGSGFRHTFEIVFRSPSKQMEVFVVTAEGGHDGKCLDRSAGVSGPGPRGLPMQSPGTEPPPVWNRF